MCMEKMPWVHIGFQAVKKHLLDLKARKATGPNDIPGTVLKNSIRSCLPSFGIVFKEPLGTHCPPWTGKHRMLHLSTKAQVKITPEIMHQYLLLLLLAKLLSILATAI